MLSDEEKAHIVDRVQFEAELRKALKSGDASAPSKWYDSKVGLLLIGSLITGLLVPVFQYTQQTFSWRRQNRYDNSKYRLSMMRDCLREFVSLSAYAGEAYERAEAALKKGRLGPKDLDAYQMQYVDFQNRRFQQNAKVSSQLIFYDKREEMSSIFNRYIGDASEFVRMLHEMVLAKQSTNSGRRGSREEGRNVDAGILKLNRSYQLLIDEMKRQISALEVENEKSM